MKNCRTFADEMSLSFFLSRRIAASRGADHLSRPTVRVATAGVAIGVVIMIVTVSIIAGFKHAIRDKIAGFGGDITVVNAQSLQEGNMLPFTADDSLLSKWSRQAHIAHVQRITDIEGVLKTDSDFLGVRFKGVDASYDTTFLARSLLSGSLPSFSDTAASNEIVLSGEIASRLQLKAGDKVYAYFLDGSGLRPRRFHVAGIYATHVKYFDQSVCFIDRYTANRLVGLEREEVSSVEMRTDDYAQNTPVWRSLAEHADRFLDKKGNEPYFMTIEQQYPQVFSWLDLLDINVWIILGLMMALSAFTMISGLLVIILERTRMIGTLKALGAQNRTIRHTFLWLAAFVVGKGIVVGNVLALALCILQGSTHLVGLNPAHYYIDYVPVEVNVWHVLLVNVCTLLVCVAVLILPSYLASRMRVVRTLNYE